MYDSTKPEEIVERAKNAEAVILNRNVISREIMQKLPKLRFIGLLATGYNTVDVKAAGELGITVCNVPLYCVETVAQQAFALHFGAVQSHRKNKRRHPRRRLG